MKRAASIGECMIELSELEPGLMRRSFGGDTLNTALYMARCLEGEAAAVAYVTALGRDPFSEEMVAAWSAEGIDTGLVFRLDDRLPGLYLIRTDDRGERQFFYWREQAAVRSLLERAGDRLRSELGGYDLVYLSGITLAIFDAAGRTRLLEVLDAVRGAGGRVAFDPNYRPRLWPNREATREIMEAACRRADIVLPTLEDETALFGDSSAEAAADRLHRLGVDEVVVKQGAGPCLVSRGGERTLLAPPAAVATPLDTTGAGDSFNAAYLAARLLGRPLREAALAGHDLAGRVVQHRGAVIPRDI